MPDFGVALAWMILAPIALVFHIMSLLFIQHYRPLFHSVDVALMSLIVTSALTSYFVIPIPAVLELGGLDWNHDSCNFYTWLSSTLRFSHLSGLLVLNVYWVNSLRAKSRKGHAFMSSFCMKISVFISWFVSVVVGLVPVTGGTELFGFYSSASCHFLPSSISRGYGILLIIASLSSVAMSIASSSDTLLIFRSMKRAALTKYNAGRFHMPSAGVSDVARSNTTTNTHATHSDLTVATELCKLALWISVVSSCLNVIPFVVMQFMLLFENEHRRTFEDVTLWLQLAEALVLPHLTWMFSSRYRHAVGYSWKVYVMRDSSAKEEDASSCTLQSYKVRAMEHHQNAQAKATLNGVKKIQANGAASSYQGPTTSGIRRPSGNKICPIEQTSNGSSVGGQGQSQGRSVLSSPSESYEVTDLDDGMTVLSAAAQQTTATKTTPTQNGNGLTSFSDIAAPTTTTNHHHHHHQQAAPPTNDITASQSGDAHSNPNDVYSRPLSKIKPLRKHHLMNSPAQGPRVAFVDVSETTSSGHGSPQIPSSSVSSPAKSLLGTPKREIDVKRTASACSRREWKEKMRKKHLPAIFVNNSVDDDKEEKVYSSIDGRSTTESQKNIDCDVTPESYEMKVVTEDENDTPQKSKRDTEIIVTNRKQQSFSEDNFYVSGEYHYDYLSDSFPRKHSLKTQSTVDSDGVCDMYESDDIGTILDTSMVSDSVSNVGVVPASDKHNRIAISETSSFTQNGIIEKDKSQMNERGSTNGADPNRVISVDSVIFLSGSESNGSISGDKPKRDSNTALIKSSLEEFEENERNVLMNDQTAMDADAERPVSRLKLIDLETKAIEKVSIKDKDNSSNKHSNPYAESVELQAVSQDYHEFETVSGSELLQLKQQAVKTIRAADEISFDSSSTDDGGSGGGVDNEAFESDGDEETRDEESGEYVTFSSDKGIFGLPTTILSKKDNSEGSDVTESDTNQDDRYVTGKEDSEESGSNQGNDQDRDIHSKLVNDNNNQFGSTVVGHLMPSVDGNSAINQLKREDFKTNPFLRESFEVIVQSPEYQQKIKSQDNPFISVKPMALPRQKSLEPPRANYDTPSGHSISIPNENDEVENTIVKSKPPLPSRPALKSTSVLGVKPKPEVTNDSNSIAAKPPVPLRKPPNLRKQSSLENSHSSNGSEEMAKRPRTSSEDELEKIFVTKDNLTDSVKNSALQENPFFPGEDPPSSIVSSSEDCSSPVFYSMSPVKKQKLNLTQSLSHDRQSEASDCSVIIEPYGQRRPPWLDESLESDPQIDDASSFTITVPVTSQYSPGFALSSTRGVDLNKAEEYDFESVKIRGVTETKLEITNNRNESASRSNSGSSLFFSSSSGGTDSGNTKITPVSGEEKPTFQFYQFDDDIEKGFEDALSVDYLTHTNVYSGFGLCFESIKEEPEDSLSESVSSYDGLGESNSSALFKTQAIISRPSSRASVNSSPNLEVVSTDGGGGTNGLNDSFGSSHRLSIFNANNDQGSFNFGEVDTVRYEHFASMENESFVTSERTSGDGREEVSVHSNGNGSALHMYPHLDKSSVGKSAADPWSLDEGGSQNDRNSVNSVSKASKHESHFSPWLEVEKVDLDMSFESDFSQQNENYLMGSNGVEHSDNSNNKSRGIGDSPQTVSKESSNGIGQKAISNSVASTPANTKEKPHTQTIHYEPVYF